MKRTLLAVLLGLGMALHGVAGEVSGKVSHGEGVVKAIDPAQNKVTLAHGPIPELKWPAMTMSFKVTDPKLLKPIHVGQRVAFDLKGEGMAVVITGVRGE